MTMRGKEQLLYMGQPFVFEKLVLTPAGQSKKIWRCNQWWNQKCRARVYTIEGQITPLNRFHTHREIVKRKQRVVKRKNADGVASQVKTLQVPLTTTNTTIVISNSSSTLVEGQSLKEQRGLKKIDLSRY
ncbi:uncharacterized protein LOC128731426 [Anopheles nili]|uniref:uncharacterized protein LOC128731426 n=1 Tax=Anopheles nili TaxID=185578 RepID=UPI00237BD9B4|nr:uncharacterized protein LOC128731426 [Anopheles nili]